MKINFYFSKNLYKTIMKIHLNINHLFFINLLLFKILKILRPPPPPKKSCYILYVIIHKMSTENFIILYNMGEFKSPGKPLMLTPL